MGKGNNLNFVVMLINLSIISIYLAPMHWCFFPFFLVLINISVFSFMTINVEKDNDESEEDCELISQKRISFRKIRSSVQNLMNVPQEEVKEEKKKLRSKP